MGQFGGLFNGGMGSVAGQNTGGYGGTTTATPDASGKLVEYNPNTMSTPFKPAAQPTPIDFNTAGMDASGIPNYLSNWLASGAQGTAPTAPQPASTAPTIAQGPVAIGTATPAPKKIGTGAMTGSGGYGGPLPAATTTAGATSSTPGKSAPGLTQVGGSNGLQAPLPSTINGISRVVRRCLWPRRRLAPPARGKPRSGPTARATTSTTRPGRSP